MLSLRELPSDEESPVVKDADNLAFFLSNERNFTPIVMKKEQKLLKNSSIWETPMQRRSTPSKLRMR